MSYFPFFANVEEIKGVVIGGGLVATEKVEKLLGFHANLTVIAPEISDEIRKYSGQLNIIEREYTASDLENADYVIAATNIRHINEQVYRDAKSRHLIINVVDMPELCNFIFPTVLQRGKLVIGVSTSGAGPQVAIRLRKQIEETIPNNIEEILDYLAKERIRAKSEIPDEKQRRKYLIELANRCLKYENWEEET